MRKYLSLIVVSFVCFQAFGQGEIDAHRGSFNDLSGSARGQAMGGAFGALGGDITGVAINPAGLGIYRSSEVVANMSIASNQTKTGAISDWNGNANTQGKTKFSFDNLAYIGYYPMAKAGIQSLNFGFNYNRIKNFDRRHTTSGSNMSSSLTDYMAYFTNGINHSAWDSQGDLYANGSLRWLSILAWDGYLINEKPGSNNAYESILDFGEKADPSLSVTERGYIESYDFSIGSNVSDRFFWGITFALTNMSYLMSSVYAEDFSGGGSFSLKNELETQGEGYQFKTGIIYKPIDALRLGVSYHSPTWYSVTDYYHATLNPVGIPDDKGTYAGVTETPNNNSHTNYHFQSPYSWTFSAAAVIGTQAVLSADYEIKDYTSMNLQDADRRDYEFENQCIDEDFRAASTLRLGLEYRFTPQFSGRLGYAYAQNPYEATFKGGDREAAISGTIPHYTIDGDVTHLTGGVGYRFTPQFYVDVAIVHSQQENELYFYPRVPDSSENNAALVNSYPASAKISTYKGLVTLGYKF